MRVNPSDSPTVTPKLPTPPERVSPGAGSKTAAPVGETSQYLPTSDLSGWLSAIRDVPDVRADIVSQAAIRLAQGEFQTPEAAADTAKSLLDSRE